MYQTGGQQKKLQWRGSNAVSFFLLHIYFISEDFNHFFLFSWIPVLSPVEEKEKHPVFSREILFNWHIFLFYLHLDEHIFDAMTQKKKHKTDQRDCGEYECYGNSDENRSFCTLKFIFILVFKCMTRSVTCYMIIFCVGEQSRLFFYKIFLKGFNFFVALGLNFYFNYLDGKRRNFI